MLEPSDFENQERWFAWIENNRVRTASASCSRRNGVYYNYHDGAVHLVGSQNIRAEAVSGAWFRNKESEAVGGLGEEINKRLNKLNNEAVILQAYYGECRRWSGKK